MRDAASLPLVSLSMTILKRLDTLISRARKNIHLLYAIEKSSMFASRLTILNGFSLAYAWVIEMRLHHGNGHLVTFLQR